jgi:hypothetical protein
MSVKVCISCKREKETTDFHNDSSKSDGLYSYCKACNKLRASNQRADPLLKDIISSQKKVWYEKNSEKLKQKVREINYSITNEEFLSKLDSQGYKCSICGMAFVFGNTATVPHIDHNHACCPKKGNSCGKCIRDLLCANCNHGLGQFKDNPEFLEKAAAYIRRYS